MDKETQQLTDRVMKNLSEIGVSSTIKNSTKKSSTLEINTEDVDKVNALFRRLN